MCVKSSLKVYVKNLSIYHGLITTISKIYILPIMPVAEGVVGVAVVVGGVVVVVRVVAVVVVVGRVVIVVA